MKRTIIIAITLLLTFCPMASAFHTSADFEEDVMTWQEVLPEYYAWHESEFGSKPTAQQQATLRQFVKWLDDDDE